MSTSMGHDREWNMGFVSISLIVFDISFFPASAYVRFALYLTEIEIKIFCLFVCFVCLKIQEFVQSMI